MNKYPVQSKEKEPELMTVMRSSDKATVPAILLQERIVHPDCK